jgi:hypothetical protein
MAKSKIATATAKANKNKFFFFKKSIEKRVYNTCIAVVPITETKPKTKTQNHQSLFPFFLSFNFDLL